MPQNYILIGCLPKTGQDEPSEPNFVFRSFLARNIVTHPPQENIHGRNSLSHPRHSFFSDPLQKK